MQTEESGGVPVLVVDDVAANLVAMQAVLGDEGYQLVFAHSGPEAIAAVEQREFAVVLLDARMPGMDGFETAVRLRDAVAGRRPIPIIFVTAADGNDDEIRRAYERGAADFVRKPLDAAVLRAKVRVFADLYRAHQHLAESELRFHHLVDAVVDYAIFMLDEEGRVATWNAGAQKAKGYLASEIHGRHFSTFYTEEDRLAGRPDALLDVVRREGRVEDRGWRVRKDGSRFWAGVVISALYGPNGEVRGFAKVTRDLTAEMASDENERVLLREQIARRELERLNQAKDQFVATLSHELRTPLNAIGGWTTILKKSPGDLPLVARGLDVIDRNVRAQTRLISDLLDVSRIVSGKLQLQLADTQLLPTFSQAADSLRPVAEAKGVALVTELSPDLGVLRADGDRLAQITWNLLSNAIRFTPRGGTVALTVGRTEREVVMEVVDTGMGIAAEDLPMLFERFNQVDNSITRAHGGLGLGLAIVKHLVEAHGGTVEGRSEGLGRGATFVARFPVPEESSLAAGGAIGR
jgi:PAS domain S-box-containing protein